MLKSIQAWIMTNTLIENIDIQYLLTYEITYVGVEDISSSYELASEFIKIT